MSKPSLLPRNPRFSSGPTTKHPGWSLKELESALTGRSHRSAEGKVRLFEVIEMHRELLGIPDDYKIGIVPASDTGAVEMAMWSMCGARGTDVLVWENFSNDWGKDAIDFMKLENARVMNAPYGQLPDLSSVNWDNDVVFPWNGTTSGARIPNHDWIPADRKGLTICDATSAVFAYEMDWSKLDVTTWSWQKVLGGEAAHGMLVLSPRAVERLETYKPDRALPKIFRMTKGGKLNDGIFKGETINTPSMLAVEDCLAALKWVKSIGGLPAMIKRSQDNLDVVEEWVATNDWVDFLTTDKEIRSATSICLRIIDDEIQALPEEDQQAFVKTITKKLANEGAAYDCAAYRTAPAGFRFWGGGTVESSDLEAALPWLTWAYNEAKAELHAKAA
ncbi:MAG: phosphoserine transaminase [Pseudobdellovibrionaceae bacterium]